MPITEFQKEVLHLLRQHRNPNSYIAGGIAIHKSHASLRYSNDVNFFHDTDEAVRTSSDADIKLLKKKGYKVEVLIDQPSFVRGTISKGHNILKVEWVRDTAFRFFPVIEDDELAYRLHDVDLAVNKCLALANRSEVRDILDLIQLSENIMSLAQICFAACGKDRGFNPALLMDCLRRNSIIEVAKLSAEHLTKTVDAVELKKQWLAMLAQADSVLDTLPVEDLGCIYLNSKGAPIRKLNFKTLSKALRHFGSIGGCWPRVLQ